MHVLESFVLSLVRGHTTRRAIVHVQLKKFMEMELLVH
jgi:hypothetical protein